MYVLNIANAPTTAPAAWDKSVLLPLILLSASLLSAALVLWRADPIHGFLSKGRRRRRVLAWLSGVGVILFALLIDRTAVAEAMNGIPLSTWDRISFSVGSVLLVACATGLYLTVSHEDKWNERLEDLESKLAAEMQLNEQLSRRFQFALKTCKTFLGIVSHKAERLREFLEQSDDPITLDRVQSVLKPESQILRILVAIYEVYSHRLSVGQRLRVSYFRREKDQLRLMNCWDGNSEKCVRSPTNKKHRNRFRFDGPGSMAVWLARQGGSLIVSDAEAADKDASHAFKYFYPEQNKKIQSVVGIALIRDGEEAPYDHVLMIDSSQKNFFQNSPSEEEELELLHENVTERLRLEADLCEIFKVSREGSRS